MLGTRDGIEEAINKANKANDGLLKEIPDSESLDAIIVAALDAIKEEKEKKSNDIDEEEEVENNMEDERAKNGVENVEGGVEVKKEKNKKLMWDFYFVIEPHCDLFYGEWECLCILYKPVDPEDQKLITAVRCLVGLYCARKKFKFLRPSMSITNPKSAKRKRRGGEKEEEKNQGNLWATS